MKRRTKWGTNIGVGVGAMAMAVALFFGYFSGSMPGGVAYAEEDVDVEAASEVEEENTDVEDDSEVEEENSDVLTAFEVEEVIPDAEEDNVNVEAASKVEEDSVLAETKEDTEHWVTVWGHIYGEIGPEPVEFEFMEMEMIQWDPHISYAGTGNRVKATVTGDTYSVRLKRGTPYNVEPWNTYYYVLGDYTIEYGQDDEVDLVAYDDGYQFDVNAIPIYNSPFKLIMDGLPKDRVFDVVFTDIWDGEQIRGKVIDGICDIRLTYDHRYKVTLENTESYVALKNYCANIDSSWIPFRSVIDCSGDCTTYCGENAEFSVNAKFGTGDYEYQWYASPDGGETWHRYKESFGNPYTDKLSFEVKSYFYKYIFKCKVTDKVTGEERFSDVMALKMPPVTIDDYYLNDSDGVNVVVWIDTTNVKKYQWYRSKDGGETWKKIYYPGRSTDEITIPMKGNLDGSLFRCELTGIDGNVYYSRPVDITIGEE